MTNCKMKLKSIPLLAYLLCFVLQAVADDGASIFVNEIQTANLDQYVDPSWNYGAWVEIYNASETSVQLRGYWVSDDPERLRKVRITQNTTIPAGGFKNLWLEHHDKYCLSQLALKLNPEGGTFYLSTSAGEVVASVEYPAIPPRSSYARTEDGGDEWSLSSTPTPSATNEGMTFCTERLEAPVVTRESQVFSGTLVFGVGIPSGCTLRYTTDGSTPTLSNGSTSTNGYFSITASSVYRFALFRSGYLSSPVVTRSFILRDKNFTLPIISVVTDSKNLYSDTMGIFVRGTNGRAGRGQSSKCNWNMDWDRPCNFELLSPEGRSLVNQETQMSRSGGWSRAWTPYSFKIHATKYFEGKNTLDYPFFDAKPYMKHKTLLIRNGGNDNNCRVKDPFLQQIVATSGLDVDYQEYQPVVHYINGLYRGVINMREPNNKQFVYANYGLDDDEIDLFEMDSDSGYVQMCGTDAAWKQLCSRSRLAASPTYYAQLCEMIDIDEFCNYIAVEFYLGAGDWPQNNLKAFRPIADGGRFRFILYDLDNTFGTTNPFNNFAGKQTYTFNTLYGESVTRYTKEIEVVTLFMNLLKNRTFRKKFIDTYCLVAGSVFEPKRCEEIMTRLANRVNDMQILNDNGYGNNSSPWGTTNSLIGSLNSRQATMIAAMKNYSTMLLTNVTGQNITLNSNIGTAKLQVNNIVVPTGKFSGTLFPPVTLKASAPRGYRFLGWSAVSDEDNGMRQTLIEEGSQWRYYDKGAQSGKNWTQLSYSDISWSQGRAPLGYGNTMTFGTVISYGSDSSRKNPASYYRRRFTIDEDIAPETTFRLNFSVDDGFVVYVNGQEAGRYNMPTGEINGTSFSVTYAPETPLAGTLTLDRSLFRSGVNVIAVEVHNNSYTSSDCYWDASLVMQQPVEYDENSEFYSTEQEIEMPTDNGTVNLIACFEKIKTDETSIRKGVVINEVSAGNSIYVNEYFKKNDWIELYNMTSEDIDLAGFYLSDNPDKPLKCCIDAEGTTASTILPANGHRIIWCDKLATATQLHVDFKLGNEDGSMVILTSPDLSYSDTLYYCAHDGLQTVGRFPDGGSDIYLMSKPTIEKENVMNSYTQLYEYDSEDQQGTDVLNARMSGLSIAYAGDELRIKSEECNRVSLMVYSVSGTMVMRQQLQMEETHASVGLSPLPSGIYIAQIRDADGNTCSVKFKK